MTALIQQYGYFGLALVVGTESLGIPLPGETALISAALYAGATHKLHIIGVILAASIGAIVGDNIGYVLGHWGGYRLLVRFGHYVRLDQAKVKVARYLFKRYGGHVVFFGRFVSILRTYAAFLAGTTRMRWPRFLRYNAAGGILWATLYGTAAYLLGKEVERLARPLTITFAVVGAIAIIVGIYFIRREEHNLERVAEAEFPGPP